MDKNLSKKVLKAENIRTAKWITVKSIEEIDYEKIEEIGYPVFVKPNNGGSSVATFKVYKKEEIKDAVMEGYRAKAAIISNAEVYQKKFAIATGTDLQVESPTIIGAQAANELLDISEIKASFVLTEYNGKIYVSARSIDEVNVQVIMEKLGGGGHMNASGAQFNHTDMDEAVACLKQVLDNMIKEGDI